LPQKRCTLLAASPKPKRGDVVSGPRRKTKTGLNLAGGGCLVYTASWNWSVKTEIPAKSSGRELRSLRLAEERNEWLAAGLAMIAGFVDAYGMITYRTFLSFMSGNTTQTGYRTGQGNFALAVPSALAIVFFVGGSFAGALLVHSAVRRIRRLVFGMVASSLVLIIGFTRLGVVSDGVGIAVISFAMGAMNAALPRVGAQSVSLTFVTGTLTGIAVHLAQAVRHASLPDSQGSSDTHQHRARLLAGIWAGFLAGALLSGATTPRFGVWVLLLPTLALSALAAFDRPSSAQPQHERRPI
jgi:uncharacterized membrane protein YoaK (UPF0700 family)